ncbi:GHKL domain-containing protein [Enterococcus thailandicus]|uniref:GHKL domain-containing protein n=1 Tax=Enterococcus thailandicus TaxID=417368 RepID=UPI0022EBB739|nr:GHKL domain-containing protein [Enterococcus thailandicus]MDA3972654.1 GHKL domain-containing protein [Enterococcus thailandicus]MDA3975150.1 GHKL domain-containing protein [Enterococcus thailandicus]MDA3980114.1 GHKL domain-containing protein [Enterococcus thailandicus]
MGIPSFIILAMIVGQLASMLFVLGYFNDELTNKKYLLFCVGIMIICIPTYMTFDVVSTGMSWLYMCATLLYFKRGYYWSFFSASLSILLYIFADNLFATGLYAVGIDSDTQVNQVIRLVINTLIYFLLAWMFKKIVIKKYLNNDLILKVSTTIVTLTFMMYFSLIVIDRYPSLNEYFGHANAFFLVLYGILSALICFSIIFIKQAEYEAKEQRNRMNYLIDYSEQIEKNYSELRKFKHDYKNILISLEDYIENDDVIGLKNYFYSSIKGTGTIFDQEILKMASVSHLEIREIKSIIISKLYSAYEQGIRVNIHVPKTIDKISVPSLILVRMLGIILDNAIEESQNVDNPEIELTVTIHNQACLFIISNRCREKIPKLHVLKQANFSTKSQDRGIGLTNLDELVQAQPNVYLETKIENNQFIQIITIFDKLN